MRFENGLIELKTICFSDCEKSVNPYVIISQQRAELVKRIICGLLTTGQAICGVSTATYADGLGLASSLSGESKAVRVQSKASPDG